MVTINDIKLCNKEVIKIEKKNKKLEEELNILQSVIDQQNNIILVTNGKNIISTNKSFYDFFNIKNIKEFIRKNKCLKNMFITHPDFFYVEDADNWIEEILKLYEKDRIISMIDTKSVEPKVFTVQLNKLNSEPNNYVVTLIDITQIKLESQKYYFDATHDGLTKIFNRIYYMDAIKIALDKFKRYQSQFSLIFLDIDNFKSVNDTYGHTQGDEVLIAISKVINNNIRKSDILARWGGEEFIILLPETFLSKAELLAQNLQKIIQNLKISDTLNVTASFGVTQVNQYDNENTIIKRADDAMYQAKNNGKNKIVSV